MPQAIIQIKGILQNDNGGSVLNIYPYIPRISGDDADLICNVQATHIIRTPGHCSPPLRPGVALTKRIF